MITQLDYDLTVIIAFVGVVGITLLTAYDFVQWLRRPKRKR